MSKEEVEAMKRVWKGEAVEKVARETGFNSFWLSMVTGKK